MMKLPRNPRKKASKKRTKFWLSMVNTPPPIYFVKVLYTNHWLVVKDFLTDGYIIFLWKTISSKSDCAKKFKPAG